MAVDLGVGEEFQEDSAEEVDLKVEVEVLGVPVVGDLSVEVEAERPNLVRYPHNAMMKLSMWRLRRMWGVLQTISDSVLAQSSAPEKPPSFRPLLPS